MNLRTLSAVVVIGMTPPLIAAQEAVVFVGATVIPMDADSVWPDHTVLVQGDRIVWVGLRSDAVLPPDARVVDAAGLFLLPGLSDMHVHTAEREFPLFLANGVTTVREMNGSARHLAWRREIAGGERLGPTMYVAGTLLSGEAQRWRHVLVESRDSAAATAASQLAAGYDFLKVYDGLTLEAYGAIVRVADSAGVPVVGHIPAAVGLERVLEHGQYAIEHVEQILNAAGGHAADTSAFTRIAERIARAGTWVTPTLAAIEVLSLTATPEVQGRFDRPEMRYVDPEIWAWWTTLRRPADATGPRAERGRWFFGLHRALARALTAGGVRIVAGTDSPNPLMVPGFALHEELRTYVELGLTPYEALRTATVNAALMVDAAGEFGVIRAGARADLVLQRGNPLEDLRHLERPAGVMVRGRWLPEERLQAILQQVAR